MLQSCRWLRHSRIRDGARRRLGQDPTDVPVAVAAGLGLEIARTGKPEMCRTRAIIAEIVLECRRRSAIGWPGRFAN